MCSKDTKCSNDHNQQWPNAYLAYEASNLMHNNTKIQTQNNDIFADLPHQPRLEILTTINNSHIHIHHPSPNNQVPPIIPYHYRLIIKHPSTYMPFEASTLKATVDFSYAVPRYQITTLMTAEDFQNLGYASALLRYICNEADQAEPPRTLNLQSLSNTIPFYRKFNFKPINATGFMRRQPRTNLLREVMRPIRKPGIFTAGYNDECDR